MKSKHTPGDMKLSELSLSDLMALYKWFESRGSSENENEYLNMKNFVSIGDEIRKRLASIDYENK